MLNFCYKEYPKFNMAIDNIRSYQVDYVLLCEQDHFL